MFGKLLESIFSVDVVLDMVGLVLLNVALILEDKLAARSSAVEVGGLLALEGAVRGAAVFGSPESLESVAQQGGVLLVEVFMS